MIEAVVTVLCYSSYSQSQYTLHILVSLQLTVLCYKIFALFISSSRSAIIIVK